MTSGEMKKMAIKASVFAFLAMGLMIHRSATKHIMITDAAGGQIDRGGADDSYSLLVDGNMPEGKSGSLIIPLPQSVSSDDIVLEDRYTDHELLLYVDSREDGFYMDNAVKTDLDMIKDAVCIKEDDTGRVCLDFFLDGLYVNESTLTDSNTIEVQFFKPSDVYDHIAVVDAAHGGTDTGYHTDELAEKDVALDIALAMKDIAVGDNESGVKIYYTRLGDIDVPADKKKQLILESGADLYVELSCNMDPGRTDGITTYYNDTYFIRGFNNAEFADLIERNCASLTGGSAIGVLPSGDGDEMLEGCIIPAARLDIGNLQGPYDQRRLSDDNYKKKMAEGLYQALIQAFEEIE